MGYTIARPAWGQGFGTEAAGAVLRFGFDRLGLHKVSATCDPANIGSVQGAGEDRDAAWKAT